MTLAVALPNWVGDAVMATPALRALRTRFPGQRIVAVARPSVRQTLDPNPWIDAYIETGKSTLDLRRTAAALRREKIETGLLMPNSFRSALAFWMGRVHRRIGYNRGGRGMFLTDALQPPRDGSRFVPTPMIQYYGALVAVLGADPSDPRMELFPTPADEAAAAAAYAKAGLDPQQTLLLCPGYAFGPSKGWPAEHWAALAAGARQRLGLEPAILCGPAETPVAQAILAAAPDCATLHDKGVTLASARAVVRQARALVAIDSGLRHYAAAFNKPVVALFGPTDIQWTDTFHRKEVRLQAVPPCGPCQEPVCPVGTTECMWKIRPEETLDALATALQRDR
jgi:heptosyltransferase II